MTEQVSARLGLWGWLNMADNRLLPERAGYGYIPGLDGLRAIAVLIVIVAHLGWITLSPADLALRFSSSFQVF